MQALRAGLKRIDGKRSKAERGKQYSSELTGDRSAWPLINYQDSNGTSPATSRPNKWESFEVGDNPLYDEEYDPTVTTQEKSRLLEHDESMQPLTGGSMAHSSTIPSDHGDLTSRLIPNLATWKPLTEYDENTPPIIKKQGSEIIDLSGWGSHISGTEIEQPLMLGHETKSSKMTHADNLTFPARNPSRWQPIEHDESTQPLMGRALKDSTKITASKENTNLELGDIQQRNNLRGRKGRLEDEKTFNRPVLQTPDETIRSKRNLNFNRGRIDKTNDLWKQKDRLEGDAIFNQPVRQKPDQKIPVSFDPFFVGDDAELPQQSRYDIFDSCRLSDNINIRDLQPNSVETAGRKQDRQTYRVDQHLYQREFHKVEPESYYYSTEDNIFVHSADAENGADLHNTDGEVIHEEENNSFQPPISSSTRNVVLEQRMNCFEGDFVSTGEAQCDGNTIDSRQEEELHISREAYTSSEPNTFHEDISVAESAADFIKYYKLRQRERDLRNDNNIPTQAYWNGLLSESVEQESGAVGENDIKSNDVRGSHGGAISNMSQQNSFCSDSGFPENMTPVKPGYATSPLSSMHIEEDDNQSGLTLVALVSEFSGTLKQRSEQERAMSILRGSNIRNIEEVDGSLKSNRDRRNKLFEVSGERGKYPQFFLQKEEKMVIYLGDFEWLTYMNDIGSLTNETIYGVLDSAHPLTKRNEIQDESERIIENQYSEKNPLFLERGVALRIPQQQINQSNCIEQLCVEDEITNGIDSDSMHVIPSIHNVSIETRSNCIPMYNADVEVIDVEAIASSRRFAESVDAREQVIEEPKLSMDIVESRNMYDGQKVQDLVHRVDEATDSNASLSSTGEKLSSRQDYEMQRESLNEDIERNESGFRSKKGRRTKLVCVGSLLDDESNREDLSISSRSARSSIKSEFISADGMQNSPSRPTSTTVSYEQERNDDTQSTTSDDENRMNTLSINVGPHRKNEIDRCSSFGKPELPRVGRDEGDETSSREKEDAERKKLEKRRKRWKRRILAEHRRRQSMGGCSVSLPGNEEQPLGASLNEIEMMNTFLAVAGPNFDGSLSAKEMEELHDRSRNAGLPVEFTNRMLDQAAGIFMCDGNNDSKLPIKQGSRIAESLPMRDNEVPSIPPPLSTNNNTYDEAGFTRKTPKEHSALDCFKSTFLAESSNIVGGDMIENIQAAVSGDSSDTKSGWRSLDMIENIKASLSGDSSDQKGGWRSIDIIGSVKATLSGDSSDNKTGWRSSNVFESIKTALSGDSESKRKSVSSENGILKPHAAPRDKSPEIENSNTYSSWPSAPIVDIVHDGDELNESGLHEC